MILAVSSMLVVPMMMLLQSLWFTFLTASAEHEILLLRSQTANEECLVMITPTINQYIWYSDTKVVARFDQQSWGSTTMNILL